MRRANSIFKCFSMVALLVFLMVNCSFLVYASDDQDNEQNRYSSAELQERDLVNQELVSSDFIAILYEYVCSGFAPKCSIDDLLGSVYGEVYKIPNYNTEQGLILATDIWYCPVLNNGKMLLLNRFYFIEGELLYTVSCGYTEVFNMEESQSAKWLFDEEGSLRSCLPGSFLYENIPEMDPFELNTEVESTIGELCGSDMRSVVSNSINVYLYPYPTKQQPGQNTCWAAAIASMVAYEYPSTYGNITATDVCFAVNHYTTAPWSTVMSALGYYFVYPYYTLTHITSYLSFNQMQNAIANDDPVYVMGLGNNNTVAHAVALMGYYKNGNKRAMEYMNPDTHAIEVGTLASAPPLSFTSSNITYSWSETVIIH